MIDDNRADKGPRSDTCWWHDLPLPVHKECFYISDDKKPEWDLLVSMLASKNLSSLAMTLKWVANPVILLWPPRIPQKLAITIRWLELCANGYGKFKVCVALANYFNGACASCKLSSKPNQCSIRNSEGRRHNEAYGEDEETLIVEPSSLPVPLTTSIEVRDGPLSKSSIKQKFGHYWFRTQNARVVKDHLINANCSTST
jgi:hypothetical protein